jgi:hypothetical protein
MAVPPKMSINRLELKTMIATPASIATIPSIYVYACDLIPRTFRQNRGGMDYKE